MKNFVITIGREFASGGKEVGKKVAKELGIEEGIFDLFDEKPTKSFLFSVVMDPYAIDSAINEGKVIEAQRKVIDNAAKESSCVIVGRRADKILAEHENVVSIFIGADIEDRMKRYLENDGTSPKNARRFIERKDRERAAYYNYFNDGSWGKADNYTMCFSTSKMDKDTIVKIIVDYVKNNFGD